MKLCNVKIYILWKIGIYVFFYCISLRINRIFYELILSLSYEYVLVIVYNILILIRVVYCRWVIVCIFILLYFLVICIFVNNGC